MPLMSWEVDEKKIRRVSTNFLLLIFGSISKKIRKIYFVVNAICRDLRNVGTSKGIACGRCGCGWRPMLAFSDSVAYVLIFM